MDTGSTVITSTGKLAPEIQAIYDNRLEKAKELDRLWSNYASVSEITKNGNTWTAFKYKYLNLKPALVPVSEFDGTNYKEGETIDRVKISYSVGRYGAYMYVEEQLKLLDLTNIQSNYIDIMGKQARLTDEHIIMNTVSSGSQVLFTDGAADLNEVADNDKKITQHDLDLIEVYLTNNGAEFVSKEYSGDRKVGTVPVQAGYVLMADISVCKDLSTLPNFIKAVEHNGVKLKNEYGRIGNFTIVQNPITKKQIVNGKKIYSSIVFGLDSYTSVSLAGEAKSRMIVKPAQDPLELVSSIGWIGYYGAAITDQSAVFRIESTAGIRDDRPNPNYSA